VDVDHKGTSRRHSAMSIACGSFRQDSFKQWHTPGGFLIGFCACYLRGDAP